MPYEYFLSLDPRWALPLAAALPLCLHYVRETKKPPLPPGPRGLPVVGNILDVPSGDIWLKFSQLGDKWGRSYAI